MLSANRRKLDDLVAVYGERLYVIVNSVGHANFLPIQTADDADFRASTPC